MDTIFHVKNYRNEISWRRSNPKSHITRNLPNCRDVILRYSKSESFFYNQVYGIHDPDYVLKAYKYEDEKGKYRLLPLLNPNDNRPNLTYEFLGVTKVWRWTKDRMQKAYEEGLIIQLKPGSVPQYKKYLEDSKGRTITNDWHDIPQPSGKEALDYPTQKPLALLDRIINLSSNKGDIVLDPFCGCGTSVAAAQKLKRKWLGIDITHLAINLMKYRLSSMFRLTSGKNYQVIGEPKDLSGARELANSNRYQFQFWALSLVGAIPYQDKKKGADTGIDGYIRFIHEKGKYKYAIVQVKSGKVSVSQIRDLCGVIEREKSEIGIFITLENPTKAMIEEAQKKDFYRSEVWGGDYPRIQIFTIEDLFAGKKPEYPSSVYQYKRAERVEERGENNKIEFD
ncbi:restriction endonuclease, partial [bacterium]|nr:restriction endonuclease [bacterium]